MKKSFWSFLALVALAGCSGGGSSAPTGSADAGAPNGSSPAMTIAMIPKGTTHVFWKSVHAGAEKAAKELNVSLIWKGPLKEDDKDEQIKVVEDFVSKKVQGICLAPLDDAALRTPVSDAQAAGVPVLIFDSALKDVDTVSFVATDNKAAGALGGERLAKLLNGKGKVMLLRYQEGSASTTEREEGFLEAIKKYPGIQVVSDNQYGLATVETAQSASENLINRFKSGATLGVDGIFTPNESTTFGMLRALDNAGFAGKVQFVGFDASEQLVKGLEDGKIQALVVQNPVKMGDLAVRTMVSNLKGEKVEKRIDTGAVVVDKQNLSEPEIDALARPKL